MRPLLAVVLVLTALAIGQWPLLREIHGMWMDKYGAYSHGYLVLVLAVALAFRLWRRPPPPGSVRPCWVALPLLAAFMLCALALDRLFVGGMRSLLLPPLLLCALAVGAGLPAARRLVGPVAFLYLVLPVWNPVNGVLQDLTTRVSGAALQALGVPVFLEGNFVHLPSGSFEIAAGCSGLNFFLAALTMGAFACAFLVDGWKRRLAIMVTAVALGLVANWIRVVSLVVIGHRTEMQHYLIRVDHLMFGWVIFLLAMVPLVLLSRALSGEEGGDSPAAWKTNETTTPGFHGAAGTFLACALLLVPVFIRGPSATAPTSAPKLDVAAFPSGWSPGFVGAAIEGGVVRGSGDGPVVEIVRARYEHQRSETRISHFQNSTLGNGWSAIESRRLDMPAGQGVVTEHKGSVGGQGSVVWDWFVVAGTPVASSKADYRLRELLSLFSGRRDAEIIALHSNCEGNCDAARAALGVVADRLLKDGDLPTASHFPQP